MPVLFLPIYTIHNEKLRASVVSLCLVFLNGKSVVSHNIEVV